ncbi:MAG TPA: DUF6036 family nucleotidyltransferase, partial [Polyangiaceae bacterium]
SIGELSPFHETFGYYAQGVEPDTALLPSGWQQRLIPICGPSTRGATGWCLEIHDLLVSKYVANREKDRRFARAAIRHGMVTKGLIIERLGQTQLAPGLREHITELVLVDFGEADRR